MSNENQLQKYLKSQDGMVLLANHSRDDVGVWEISSPNDYPISSSNCMGIRSGKLIDVIQEATSTKGFYNGINFGTIKKLDVQPAAPKIEETVLVTIQLRVLRPVNVTIEDFLNKDIFNINHHYIDLIDIKNIEQINP